MNTMAEYFMFIYLKKIHVYMKLGRIRNLMVGVAFRRQYFFRVNVLQGKAAPKAKISK
jgi:hypothetical protein